MQRKSPMYPFIYLFNFGNRFIVSLFREHWAPGLGSTTILYQHYDKLCGYIPFLAFYG